VTGSALVVEGNLAGDRIASGMRGAGDGQQTKDDGELSEAVAHGGLRVRVFSVYAFH
jgi:hypothetical protein